MPDAQTPTIDRLLAQRNAFRLDSGGDPAMARVRFLLNRWLWENYDAFNPLRLHIAHNGQRPLDHAKGLGAVVARLVDEGMIRGGGGRYRARDLEARQWLLGGWLEELGYIAMLDAGADEAFYAQRIGWRVGTVEGENEIDVIARKGDVLSFMSCKAVSPDYIDASARERDKYRDFLLEADYWEAHFADGKGRAVLLLSTDLIDETQNDSPFCPVLLARANILDVEVIGRELDPWPNLVNRLREHWA